MCSRCRYVCFSGSHRQTHNQNTMMKEYRVPWEPWGAYCQETWARFGGYCTAIIQSITLDKLFLVRGAVRVPSGPQEHSSLLHPEGLHAHNRVHQWQCTNEQANSQMGTPGRQEHVSPERGTVYRIQNYIRGNTASTETTRDMGTIIKFLTKQSTNEELVPPLPST